MLPVKRHDTPGTYVGEREEGGETVLEGVGDLPFKRDGGAVVSYWQPSEDELVVLNNGGHVELAIYHEPIPPVAVNVAAWEAEDGV